MKKIKLILPMLLFSAVTLVGCSDEFLNDPKPEGALNEEQAFESKAAVESYISGLMRFQRFQYVTDGGARTTDAGGLYAYFFARDVKGKDLIQSENWYLYDYGHENREPTYRRTLFSWEFGYKMIKHANVLVAGINRAGNISNADKNELMAQALGLRAFYYFQLILEFQYAYAVNPSAPSLPVYLERTTEGAPLSTMQEVYDVIVNDLTTAVSIASDSRRSKGYMNKEVLNGLLANVYLTMGNWPGAEQAANAAYGGNLSSLNAASYSDGFNNMGNSEWMWGMAQSLDQSNYYFGAPHSMSDHLTESYQATYIDREFVALFSPTDVRNLFINLYGATDWRQYQTTKFTFSFDADHAIMRTPEMILIDAEAKVRQGQDGPGHDLLYALQVNRDPNAVRSTNTGAALLAEIMVERRKELYGEIGIEWFDAKRNRTAIVRGSHHRVPMTIPADSNLFYLKIPQRELDVNTNIPPNINNGR